MPGDDNAPGAGGVTSNDQVVAGSDTSLVPAAENSAQLSRDAAERLTQRISLKLGSLADTYQSVMPLIREAIDRNAHEALDYPSVGAYVQDRFGESLTRLGVDPRRDVVRELTAAGMSTRAIAPVLGVSKDTVHRDQQATVSHETVDRDRDATESNDSVARPSKITGLDGRERPATQPHRAPRRRPLSDAFMYAQIDLRRLTDRIEKLASDDRVARNAGQLAGYANLIDQHAATLQKSAAKIRNGADPDGEVER